MQVNMYAYMQVCKCYSVPLYKYVNMMQVWNYASIQVSKYPRMQVCKNASMQWCKFKSMQAWKSASNYEWMYASMKVCRNEIMQVYK